MSKTPVETSGEVNFRVASHLSKLPSIATEAFTKNLTVLTPGVTTKTGACARLTDGSTADAKRQRTAMSAVVRMLRLCVVSFRALMGVAAVSWANIGSARIARIGALAMWFCLCGACIFFSLIRASICHPDASSIHRRVHTSNGALQNQCTIGQLRTQHSG